MTRKVENLPHQLRPEHIILSEDEKAKLLEKLGISFGQLPKIYDSDPALIGLGAKAGNVVKIKRKDIVGDYDYFRAVIED